MDEDERRWERIEREAKRAERERRRAANRMLSARADEAFKATLNKFGAEEAARDKELWRRLAERNTLWQDTNKKAIREWWEEGGKQEATRKFSKARRGRALN